ncbi:MAG: UDP-N-acetylmuramoyl-tripeptide--D-alanyl-D-alanine ligase, partial [Aggregatilineales bacterium]
IATDIVLVGPKQTQPIREGVESTSFPREQLQVVNHVSEAIAWYRAQLKAGDAVLLLNDLPDTY